MSSNSRVGVMTTAGVAAAMCSTAFLAPSAPSVAPSRDVAPAQLRGSAAAHGSAPMVQAAGVAALLAATVSVAKSSRTRRSPLKAFETELGAQAPLGFFDPAGLVKDGDAGKFYNYRAAEIKHGRVAMLAAMGYIAPEAGPKFAGYISPTLGVKFSDIPNGLAAFEKVPVAGVAQYFLFVGFLELYAAKQDPKDPPGKLSGNDEGYGPMTFGRLGLPKTGGISDPSAKAKSLNSELANGRLAMMAVMGMIFQNGVTGTTGSEMWGLGAFESELGAQAPLGFFDPLGFVKNGDAINFKRRRQEELKHGRTAMWATLGYIIPEYFRFPGFLDPTKGLKFTDLPNGIAAMSKLPLAGGMQIFLFVGALETLVLKQDGKREPGDYENIGYLGVPYAEGIADPAARKRSLNSELANGRLAMLAIIGMIVQNGIFGTTGPQMWFPAPAA